MCVSVCYTENILHHCSFLNIRANFRRNNIMIWRAAENSQKTEPLVYIKRHSVMRFSSLRSPQKRSGILCRKKILIWYCKKVFHTSTNNSPVRTIQDGQICRLVYQRDGLDWVRAPRVCVCVSLFKVSEWGLERNTKTLCQGFSLWVCRFLLKITVKCLSNGSTLNRGALKVVWGLTYWGLHRRTWGQVLEQPELAVMPNLR